MTSVEPPSMLQRLGLVFTSPDKAMSSPIPTRSWWIPLLVTIVIAYTFSMVTVHRVGIDSLAATMIADNAPLQARLANATPQVSAQLTHSVEQTIKFSLFGIPVVVIVFNFVIALVLMGSVNLALGGKTTFAKMLTVVMLAGLIIDVRTLLATGVVLFDPDPSAFSLSNPVGTNLGFFFSHPGLNGGLKTLLDALDAVTVWYLAVLGLGCAAAAGLKKSAGLSLVFGWWFVFIFTRVTLESLSNIS